MTKHETIIQVVKPISSFGFCHYFVIRHSSFFFVPTVIRHFSIHEA